MWHQFSRALKLPTVLVKEKALKAKKVTNNNKQLETQEKILLAAIHCFSETGVGSTKLNQIAKEAKIDPPHLYYYFPNFEALFAAVVDRVLEDLRNHSIKEIEKNKHDPWKALKSYIGVPFSWAKEKPQFRSIWLYFYHLASHNQRYADLNRNIREIGRDRISLLIYRGIDSGKFHLNDGWTVPKVAMLIQGLMTGLALMASTEGEKDAKNFDPFLEVALHTVQDALGISKN